MASAEARAAARAADTEAPELATGEPCRATEEVTTSVSSTSAKVTEPVSVRKLPVSTVPVLGLSATGATSSWTVPLTSTTVMVGVSLVPVMVTVTSWKVLAVPVPLSSWTVMR
jgi:hypothetical protein